MRFKLVRLLLPAIIFSAISLAWGAENTDVVFIEYKYLSPSNDRLHNDSTSARDIRTVHHNLNTKVTIPLYKTDAEKPVRVFTMLQYELIHAAYRETGSNTVLLNSIETLHALKAGLASYVPLGASSGMYFDLAGSINTDLGQFKEIDSKDVITSGNIIFNYKYSSLFFRFGLTSTSKFGRPLIIPILGLTWKPVSRFKYKLLIPHGTSAWFQYSIFQAGLFARLKGNQFRLIRNDAANNYSVSLLMVETGFSLRFNVWNKLHVYGDFGVHPYRSLTVYKADNSTSSEINYSRAFNDMLFMRFGVAYSAI
ncbi:MAG: hypothetical protein GY754_09295 [bacterium]|nr:hypothetical protein [bacterium]